VVRSDVIHSDEEHHGYYSRVLNRGAIHHPY
jgi:hypothetical protein